MPVDIWTFHYLQNCRLRL